MVGGRANTVIFIALIALAMALPGCITAPATGALPSQSAEVTKTSNNEPVQDAALNPENDEPAIGNPAQPVSKENIDNKVIDRGSGYQPSTIELVIDTFNFGFTMNNVEIRKGDTVRLTMKVTSGTHGISIPAFGVSVGPASAGQEKTVEFVADKAGTFPFKCNVYCGSGHSSMAGKLTVLD